MLAMYIYHLVYVMKTGAKQTSSLTQYSHLSLGPHSEILITIVIKLRNSQLSVSIEGCRGCVINVTN